MSSDPLYGLIAEFGDEKALVHAAKRARADGYRRIDAYAPFSVDGLSDALGFRHDRIALTTLSAELRAAPAAISSNGIQPLLITRLIPAAGRCKAGRLLFPRRSR